MPELTEQDALKIAREYYQRQFGQKDANRIVEILIKVDMAGLITHAYETGLATGINMAAAAFEKGLKGEKVK